MNVAFCINRLALAGFGPTLTSLIRNCSKTEELSIWILCTDFLISDQNSINELLTEENFKGKHTYIEFDAKKEFGKFSSLHGDWTTYGRLLLPDLLSEESSVLYLDADLIVELDVLSLKDFDFENKGLAAVSGSTLKYALDHPFLINRLDLSLESKYFNCGILLFNLDMWRKENYKKQCLDIADKYPQELVSHDQTLLNAVFNSNFSLLPSHFNCPWSADKFRPAVAEKMIMHYIGSPKPWDLAGKFMHSGYATWKEYLTKRWQSKYVKVDLNSFKRVWKIQRSYVRVINKKFKSRLSNKKTIEVKLLIPEITIPQNTDIPAIPIEA